MSFDQLVNVLLIIPKIWLPLEAALKHCFPTLRSWQMVTPKSFSYLIMPRGMPFNAYSSILFLNPIFTTLHFPTLNIICHFFTQLAKSILSRPISSYECTLPMSLTPSANFNISLLISSSRSLIKIVNKVWPKTDPCGTPYVTSVHQDCCPLIITLWRLPVRHFSIYVPWPTIPWALILFQQPHIYAELCRTSSRNPGILRLRSSFVNML